MGCVKCLVLLGVIVAGLAIGFSFLSTPQEVPELKENYWGPGLPPAKEDTSIKPFKINVPDDVLQDLKRRLDATRSLAPPLEGVQQQYGMNSNLLKEILDFWRTKYNWREREKFLNQYPQFKTTIQGLDIHYLHVKPAKPDGAKVLPLLMLHGWPGSVREFYEAIPLLTTKSKDKNIVFELIIPSLPGYGYSQASSKPGLSPTHMAIVFKNLMKRVGFEKFYVQGGDWGALIGSNMARLYPEKVLGFHSNMCAVNTPMANIKMLLGSLYPPAIVDKKYESRMYPISNVFSYIMLETGYFHLQATKPDTVGVALNDSPGGMAAYILEKFTTWTKPEWKERLDGGLTEIFTYTNLLDNLMIYWTTNSITTSVRLYSEAFSKNEFGYKMDNVPIKVPTACMKNLNDLAFQSDCLLKEIYVNLVQTSHNLDIGHFAAFESPKRFAEDVLSAVGKMDKIPKSKTT